MARWDEVLTGSDAVLLVTDHTGFDYQRIRDLSVALVDARNAFTGVEGVVDAGRWVIKG